jgi:hypothetical protein
MKTTVRALLASLAGVSLMLSGVALLHAQSQRRYMDSAGTIHWVDDPSQVPQKYRAQVQTPTPTPVLDQRAINEMKRKQQEAERERQRVDSERRREVERRKRLMEQQRIREERELKRRDDARNINQVR